MNFLARVFRYVIEYSSFILVFFYLSVKMLKWLPHYERCIACLFSRVLWLTRYRRLCSMGRYTQASGFLGYYNNQIPTAVFQAATHKPRGSLVIIMTRYRRLCCMGRYTQASGFPGYYNDQIPTAVLHGPLYTSQTTKRCHYVYINLRVLLFKVKLSWP